MTDSPGLFFDGFGVAALVPQQNALWQKFGSKFRSRSACREFFSYMVTPASGRWAFRPVGKAASTSALSGLFHVEFGAPPTADLRDPKEINETPMPHRLIWHGVSPRDEQRQLTGFAGRALRAMNNHFESLILFGIAALVVTYADKATEIAALLSMIYLAARILYLPAYLMGLTPWRSLIWAVGLLATTLMLVMALL